MKKNSAQFREIYFGSHDTLIRPVFFWENCFYSFIYISTILFDYTFISASTKYELNQRWVR